MDMIMVYLIVRVLEGISFDRLFTYCDLPTRSNGYKLYKNHCHLNARKNFSLKGVSMIGTVYPETSLNHQKQLFLNLSYIDVYWQDLRFRFLDS